MSADPLASDYFGDCRDGEDRGRIIDALVARRTTLGMSQAQVAFRMGVTQSQVAKIERVGGGDRQVSTLQRYARAVRARVRLVLDEEVTG